MEPARVSTDIFAALAGRAERDQFIIDANEGVSHGQCT